MVRFHLGGSGLKFLNLSCSDFDFIAKEISTINIKRQRDHIEAISFGAFQTACLNGQYKKSWREYRRAFGLFSDGSQTVDKKEKERLVKHAVSIYEKNLRSRNVKKKNI